MTHPAINQLRRILQWAGVPDSDATAQAVIRAGRTGDVAAAISALDADRGKVGMLSYMVDDLKARWYQEQQATVAEAAA